MILHASQLAGHCDNKLICGSTCVNQLYVVLFTTHTSAAMQQFLALLWCQQFYFCMFSNSFWPNHKLWSRVYMIQIPQSDTFSASLLLYASLSLCNLTFVEKLLLHLQCHHMLSSTPSIFFHSLCSSLNASCMCEDIHVMLKAENEEPGESRGQQCAVQSLTLRWNQFAFFKST